MVHFELLMQMFEPLVLFLLAFLPITTSVKCQHYSPLTHPNKQLVHSFYCAFTMTENCENGDYMEGPPWNLNREGDKCFIQSNMLACSCSKSDFCSTDHKYIWKLWRKSSAFKKDSLFTECLRNLAKIDDDEDDLSETISLDRVEKVSGERDNGDYDYTMTLRSSNYKYTYIVFFVVALTIT
ncbi:unnamed protein product [Cylicocyclus nassatus]|uniref:Uncharacterized protein n=1 Tax=Cylicocyclus nassatus TaxID=53992 RepID=A0AA36GF09_CYLNA|nr:unnamed protein product [Cylicocyclus nassatus]